LLQYVNSLDALDAADLVKKEKLARQLATRLVSIARPPDCPLFEHFLVFGHSNKNADPPKPMPIFQYPPDKPVLLQALEQFVFPTGMPNDRDTSRLANSVADFHNKNPDHSFVLLLTTSIKEVFYAICVVDEFLKPYPTFIPPTNEPTHSKLPFSTRCYVLITRYPLFDLMFDVLHHILDVEEKSLTLPAHHRAGELNQVNRILEHLWTLAAPPPGGSINLGIPRIPTYLRPTRHEDENLISSHCVPTLFWSLSKDQILGLVSAALLEKKMLFVHSNLRILSNCILSFIALLKPFVLQCVFIPILPDDLLQIAEAPVPFIAGLANPKLIRAARDSNPELIVIDLTTKRIYCPDEVDVPPLPNMKGLSHAIDPYVVQLRKNFDKYVPPYKVTKTVKDLVTELLRLLEQYITPYFEAFRRHCITSLTDNVTIFVKETYLIEETDATSINFFYPFMETQIFAHWCDAKLNEIDHQRLARYTNGAGSTKIPFSTSSSLTSPIPSITSSSSSSPAPGGAASLAGLRIARPASTDDLSSLNSSSERHLLTPHSKGLGSPQTRNRSSSFSSSNNDAFVASLQFDLADSESFSSSDSTPISLASRSVPTSATVSPQPPLSVSDNGREGRTLIETEQTKDSTKLRSSDSMVKPRSSSALSTIRED
jgi:hypothetical protein